MKTNLLITTGLLLAMVPSFRAQTADDYVSQGRGFLAATNLTAAHSRFSTAVTLSPTHQTANVFYAATRLLVLPYQAPGSNFMNRLGIPVAGRDIYNWTARPPVDTNDVPLAPSHVNANELTAILRTNVLTACQEAGASLAKVTDTNFILNLTSNETRMASVTMDYGDIQMLRAMLHAAEYFAYTAYSWNLDAQLSAIRALYTSDQLSIERVLMDYPNLLSFSSTNDLLAAQAAFQKGVEQYLDASRIIRSRSTNITRLFNYDPSKAQDEEKFRLTINDLKRSLVDAIPLSVDTNYTVFLSAQFNGSHPLRSFLPVIRENGFALETLPDPTFGGLIYGIAKQDIEEVLAEHLLPIPTMAPAHRINRGEIQFPINVAKGRGYVVQVSTNLLNWSDYLSFASMGRSYGFLDPDAQKIPGRYYRVVDRTGKMPPPANDKFENRSLIPEMNVPVVGYTDGASRQDGEPLTYPGHTVWWTWTSPASAEICVLATGEGTGWQVAVFTGTSLGGLARITDGWNLARFMAQSGTTYQIAVDTGWKDGAVQLVITRPPVLTVTSPPEGAEFTAPANIIISGSASDPDGQIRRLTVSGLPNLNFQTADKSFNFVWTNVPVGNYEVYYSAMDDLGAVSWKSRLIHVAP